MSSETEKRKKGTQNASFLPLGNAGLSVEGRGSGSTKEGGGEDKLHSYYCWNEIDSSECENRERGVASWGVVWWSCVVGGSGWHVLRRL